MPIVAGDILLKYSIKTGSAGNSQTSAASTSLGKYISTTQVGTAINDQFDDVTGPENAASESEYRCFFVHNNHGSITAENVGVYLSAEVANGASIAIAIDNVAASAIGSGTAQASEIANEDTAPSGVGTFSSPTTAGTALSLGNIAAGSCRAFWVRRTTANTAALNNDGWTVGIRLDTAA